MRFLFFILFVVFSSVLVANAESGSGIALDRVAMIQPAATSAPPIADEIVNPIEQPGRAMDDFAKAKKFGWGIAVLFVLISAMHAIASLGRRVSALVFLTRGRTVVALAGGLTVSVAAYNALLLRGELVAAGIAALGALAAFMWPAPPASAVTIKPIE
jgi:hypothetical protein